MEALPDLPVEENGRLNDPTLRESFVTRACTYHEWKQLITKGLSAAGLIAFGVGLLVSSLIPASRKEQQAVGKLQDNLEPLKQQVGDVAKEMADNLREPAQQAVESIKSVAADGAANVKGEAQSAKDDVAARAQESKDAVQDAQSH